ncbi:hypothetical protein DFH27DRAFT_398644 [Peziza echinospora]|nr:hypothetical protein DFH27DRAFT_398644 [Peziza echinospora]
MSFPGKPSRLGKPLREVELFAFGPRHDSPRHRPALAQPTKPVPPTISNPLACLLDTDTAPQSPEPPCLPPSSNMSPVSSHTTESDLADQLQRRLCMNGGNESLAAPSMMNQQPGAATKSNPVSQEVSAAATNPPINPEPSLIVGGRRSVAPFIPSFGKHVHTPPSSPKIRGISDKDQVSPSLAQLERLRNTTPPASPDGATTIPVVDVERSLAELQAQTQNMSISGMRAGGLVVPYTKSHEQILDPPVVSSFGTGPAAQQGQHEGQHQDFREHYHVRRYRSNPQFNSSAANAASASSINSPTASEPQSSQTSVFKGSNETNTTPVPNSYNTIRTVAMQSRPSSPLLPICSRDLMGHGENNLMFGMDLFAALAAKRYRGPIIPASAARTERVYNNNYIWRGGASPGFSASGAAGAASGRVAKKKITTGAEKAAGARRGMATASPVPYSIGRGKGRGIGIGIGGCAGGIAAARERIMNLQRERESSLMRRVDQTKVWVTEGGQGGHWVRRQALLGSGQTTQEQEEREGLRDEVLEGMQDVDVGVVECNDAFENEEMGGVEAECEDGDVEMM